VGLIYLDSCIVIYLAEKHERWADTVIELMDRTSATEFGISPLVKCECLVGPIRQGDSVLREGYEGIFRDYISLDMPEPVFVKAAELRAQHRINTPDALHLACAQYHRCDVLWTNDNRFARGSQGYVRNVLAGARP
jgi:uncharacterized protein